MPPLNVGGGSYVPPVGAGGPPGGSYVPCLALVFDHSWLYWLVDYERARQPVERKNVQHSSHWEKID